MGNTSSSNGSRPPEPEFTQLCEKFDSLLSNNCTEEMVALTDCLNQAAVDTSGARDDRAAVIDSRRCRKQMQVMNRCRHKRGSQLAVVKSGCIDLYEAYEQCMKANGTEPDKCIQKLQQLYKCAELKLNEDET